LGEGKRKGKEREGGGKGGGGRGRGLRWSSGWTPSWGAQAQPRSAPPRPAAPSGDSASTSYPHNKPTSAVRQPAPGGRHGHDTTALLSFDDRVSVRVLGC
jgi:hypothetical protein